MTAEIFYGSVVAATAAVNAKHFDDVYKVGKEGNDWKRGTGRLVGLWNFAMITLVTGFELVRHWEGLKNLATDPVVGVVFAGIVATSTLAIASGFGCVVGRATETISRELWRKGANDEKRK